jgi:hypothetical protein
MSVNYNFVPDVLPPGLMELARLTSADYQPNLGNIPERWFFCWLFNASLPNVSFLEFASVRYNIYVND